MDKLLAYLIAGARLTGCKSSVTCVDPPHTRDLTTPAGMVYHWRDDRPRVDVQRGGRVHEMPGIDIRDLLAAWQPDQESSISRQHYIDTGHYLPVGAAERLALGVEDDLIGDGWDERPCVLALEGHDTDGSAWSRCTTHGEEVYGSPDDALPFCEGYRRRPYVDPAGRQILIGVKVDLWRSTADGVDVVQIDTPGHEGRLRVNLNDAPIWDQDPEVEAFHAAVDVPDPRDVALDAIFEEMQEWNLRGRVGQVAALETVLAALRLAGREI